jgi:hypothetical protein
MLGATDEGIFSRPRAIDGLEGCFFYHTMDLPELGLVQGIWDLRDRLRDYLGGGLPDAACWK